LIYFLLALAGFVFGAGIVAALIIRKLLKAVDDALESARRTF
jgi:hypothetical protein